MGKKSIALIDHMVVIVEAIKPVTGRGVGYKLFVRKLIQSMGTADMKQVYRLLRMPARTALSRGIRSSMRAANLRSAGAGMIPRITRQR